MILPSFFPDASHNENAKIFMRRVTTPRVAFLLIFLRRFGDV